MFYKVLKVLFIIVFLTNCSDSAEEISGQTFVGSFSSDNTSVPPCPSGAGAEIGLDFLKSTISLKIPETDLNGTFSSVLAAANSTINSDGGLMYDSTSGTFAAAFLFEDTDENFDASGCLNAGDSYAGQVRIELSGFVSESSISQASYQVYNICSADSVLPQICSGSLTASKQ